ncbi:MAG: hypothetical protein HRU69_14130 [Flammeovirgaceae bacterium]|nr:MAG: hypothetical protein HRU69_14130 [Flammeovirgaceae bacterium]
MRTYCKTNSHFKSLIFIALLTCGITLSSAQNYSAPSGAGNSGTDNVSLGTSAGNGGSYNSAVGKQAGDVVTGSYNAFFGNLSGRVNNSASNNSFFGARSGYSTTTGGNNTFLGAYAGYSNVSGTGNIFIGANAGYYETGSNKLYIDNTNTGTPLIFGDFSSRRVGINALPGNYTLNVGGSINATGTISTSGTLNIGATAVPNGYKLAVAGKIITEEIVVKLQNAWPDYVFKPDYNRLSLVELAEYISKNGHLPGIPMETQIKEEGINLSQMTIKLLEKVEELSLYIIE